MGIREKHKEAKELKSKLEKYRNKIASSYVRDRNLEKTRRKILPMKDEIDKLQQELSIREEEIRIHWKTFVIFFRQ